MERYASLECAVSVGGTERVRYGDTALYFYNEEDTLFRLTWEGVNGWRLQASALNDGSFCDVGASQSLSLYMGERIGGAPQSLEMSADEDRVTVRAHDGTAASLFLKGDFALAFLDASGRELSRICALSLKDGGVTVKGTLSDNEGVFGGGERFDAINKRGSVMDLYTSDGWNRSDTSYLVIPLFLTTRGAGFFFNHYEPATADFGVARSDEWCYTMESDHLDCYFYATGRAEDVYRGYTELSGHGRPPAPWMHGVQICRSGYDFSSFDVDSSYDTLRELPDYDVCYLKRGEEYVKLTDASDTERAECQIVYAERNGAYVAVHLKNDEGRYYRCGYQSNPVGDSVKTIMQRFIREDMKPDAVIMEGFGWGACYSDDDAGRAHREELRRAIEWLHENGIRAMVYIRVGGVRSNAIGFKEEYKVHADVEIRGADGTVKCLKNTTQIPWMVGTGANPDGSSKSDDYIDITNEEALEWYFDRIWGDSISLGIDGVKIDFCECMPDGDKQYATTRTHYLWKNPECMQRGVEHHAYASYFISRFYKRMHELQEKGKIGDGFMVLSRGGGIGSQRNPYLWAGDQVRTFEKLDDLLFSVVNSGLSGVPFMTYDMGGYHYVGKFGYYREGQREYESEVFARAVEFTAFTTNIQTHGDVRHVYEMTEEVKEIYRIYTSIHKQLIPYVSRYAKIACETGMPVVRHPVLYDLQDASLYGIEDEFMLGEGLLIAPILKENTRVRDVYLPRGRWIDLLTGETHTGGKRIQVEVEMRQIPVFLNADSADSSELRPIFEGEAWKRVIG